MTFALPIPLGEPLKPVEYSFVTRNHVYRIACPGCGWTRPVPRTTLRAQQRSGCPLGRCGSCARRGRDIAAQDAARAEERTRIVAWLREDTSETMIARVLRIAADGIERGMHEKKER